MLFKQTNLTTENQTFSKIMGNGNRYEVPLFQRDYSWGEEQLNELWEDIAQMQAEKVQHFMGYLVFQSNDGKRFAVIDGQQRLTTLMLIYIAGLSRLQELIALATATAESKQANQSRLELYVQTYIGVMDGVTLEKDKKLKLNKNNGHHFNDLIDNYGPSRRRNMTKSNRRINNAFGFFVKQLKNTHSGEAIAELFNNIADGLIFSVVKVADELNAYIVFETLNSRGVHLSVPDLLKNYLLSLLHQQQQDAEVLDEFQDRWADIIEQLGKTDFTHFLRSHMGMSQSLPYKKDLFKRLKQTIDTPDKVAPFFSEIAKTAPVYAALQQFDDSFWPDHFPNSAVAIRNSLEALNIFNIKTPLSLLMAVQQKLSIEDFATVLRWIKNISIRYNVIGQRPAHEQEFIYNKIARKVTDAQWQKQDIKTALKPLYIEDRVFKDEFANKSMPSRQSSKKIVYLLTQIETHFADGMKSTNLSLEHVLPYKPNDQWQESFGVDEYTSAIDRLGNMTLLTANQNNDLGQELWLEKRTYFKGSPLKLHQQLASYDAWTIDAVRDYQQFLAKQAIAVWKIPDL